MEAGGGKDAENRNSAHGGPVGDPGRQGLGRRLSFNAVRADVGTEQESRSGVVHVACMMSLRGLRS